MVVVGDKPGDADVNHGIVPDERCIKIGFFDHSREHPHPDLPPLPSRTRTPTAAHPAGAAPAGDGLSSGCDSEQIGVSPHVVGVVPREEVSPQRQKGQPRTEKDGVAEGIELVCDSVSLLECTVEVGAKSAAAVESASSEDRIAGSQGGGEISVSRTTSTSSTAATASSVMGGIVETTRSTSIVTVDCGGSLALRGSDDGDATSLPGGGGGAVEVEEMLLAYGESFDVVARGGHSMDIVADLIRRLIGELDSRGDVASSPT